MRVCSGAISFLWPFVPWTKCPAVARKPTCRATGVFAVRWLCNVKPEVPRWKLCFTGLFCCSCLRFSS